MNTQKLDKAWPVFEEISREQINRHCVSVGYLIGGALPMEEEVKQQQSEVQSLTTLDLSGHPDPNLSAAEYGRALNESLIHGLATALDLERVIVPTEDFAERLKKMQASYFEYIGLAVIMNDWFETLGEELVARGFNADEFTDEELNALTLRSVGDQGDLYLRLLERKAG